MHASAGLDSECVPQHLLAQLAAQARADPEKIRRIVRDNEDGTFTVTLHIKEGPRRVKKEVTVDGRFPHDRDGHLACGRPRDRDRRGEELWVMVLEAVDPAGRKVWLRTPSGEKHLFDWPVENVVRYFDSNRIESK
jgi:hypothetical protein